MPDHPRILFLLSSDFGELASALYFTAGQPLTPTFLLPQRTFALHGHTLPLPLVPYTSPNDILSTFQSQKPDALFLFSGYLLGVNALLTTPALSLILNEARKLGVPIATTDPFLGLLSPENPAPFSPHHPLAGRLTAHFSQVSTLLKDTHHLYLCDPANLTSAPSHGFYNPALVSTPDTAEVLARHNFAPAVRPRWLFTLSAEDYASQCNTFGMDNFHQTLLSMLHQTLAQGRRPLLVAPSSVIKTLNQLAPELPPSILVPFCPIDLFRALSYDAEIAFYWNVLSNSVLSRVAANGPVFFFNPGHLVHSIPAIQPLALERYYANAPLPLLNPRDPLLAPDLLQQAAAQPALFAPALAGFTRLPSPWQIVDQLLRGSAP